MEERYVHTVEVRGSRPLSPTPKPQVRPPMCGPPAGVSSFQVHARCTGFFGTGHHDADLDGGNGTNRHWLNEAGNADNEVRRLVACRSRSKNSPPG